MASFHWRSPGAIGFVAGAGIAGICALVAVSWASATYSSRPFSEEETIHSSPLFTVLPKLSDAERSHLPYPPDVLPGARDVDSPYGSIRVYEWGPEDGRRVLFLHGISTPALSLAALAETLAQNGCRVMLFDLFGRGYSSGPSDLRYDIRLYTSQILLVVSSSKLNWKSFSLVGYSLGGGISAVFASYFPHLIESLVLIAPGGLVRQRHFSWRSKLMYSKGILPEWLLEWVVKRRLSSGNRNDPETSKIDKDGKQVEKRDLEEAVNAEVPDSTVERRVEIPGSKFNGASLSKSRPDVNIASVVSWQLANHIGFVPAFMSSIRYAPIHTQHQSFRRIGERLSAADGGDGSRGMSGRVLLVLGKSDPLIIKDEIIEDATEALGAGNLMVKVMDAGHEVPITKSKDVADAIFDLWS